LIFVFLFSGIILYPFDQAMGWEKAEQKKKRTNKVLYDQKKWIFADVSVVELRRSLDFHAGHPSSCWNNT